MLAVALFCLYIISRNLNNGRSALIPGAIAAASLFAAYKAYYASTIEFDDENMYVTNKRFDDVIPLKNVTAVKLTSLQVNQMHFWKICYYDSLNDKQTLSILPLYKGLNLFMTRVEEKNPGAEIKTTTGFLG
jgi:hypothetical protein